MGPGCSPHLSPRMPDCLAAGSGAPESAQRFESSTRKLGPVPLPPGFGGAIVWGCALPWLPPSRQLLAQGHVPAEVVSPTTPAVCPPAVGRGGGGGSGWSLWGSCLLPPSTPSP